MKYIKLFEEINEGEPKMGDYVLCHEVGQEDNDPFDFVNDFLDNNIGVIIDANFTDKYPFLVGFTVSNTNLLTSNNCREFKKDEFKYWSKNKSELETIIYANKYNI